MKITFNGHSATERETELTKEELAVLFEVMVQKFRDHIEFGRFDSAFPSYAETALIKLCNNHSVDVEYTKDRLAFFEAVLERMENPYK